MTLERELRILKSILKVSQRRDMRNSTSGKGLLSKGFISKNTGKITKKGKLALKLL